MHPTPVANPEITMITLVAAGSISLHRAFRVRNIARKYNLISLNLDAKNSIKDGSASFVGFGSVLAGYFGIPYMDAIGSIIIAGYIFYMAYMAFKESTLVLVDAVKNPEIEQEISRFVEHKFDVNVDDVLIRPLGHALSAQVHVALDQNLSLKDAHDILTKINAAVADKFGTEETTVIPRPV
jgi:divalent metal cation (Fe/Co/Zn/Cd) transporter